MIHKNINIRLVVCTADRKYFYSDVIDETKTLHDWVNIVHQYQSEKYGWNSKPLIPGSFGYDNLVHSIARVLCNRTLSRDELANQVHLAWIHNYTFWRDYQPWIKDLRYKAPFNALGDERRESLANLAFKDLPEDEQVKDYDIVDAILKTLVVVD